MAKRKQKPKSCQDCGHAFTGFHRKVLVTRCHLASRNVPRGMKACQYWIKKGDSE